MILYGKDIAEKIKGEVREKVKNLKEIPCLACIIVEGNPASEIYVAMKQKACADCGLNSKLVRLENNVSQHELEKVIENLNKNAQITAILLQLPLPKHLNEQSALEKISPEKDVDCLTSINLGRLFAGRSSFAPCTAYGIIRLLDENDIKIEGKNVCVVGRSLLVGKSVATLFEQRNATVTLCHSKSKNLQAITSQADILVSAVGKKQFITSNFVKDGAVVIDVGVCRCDGVIYGDLDFENLKDKCFYITPCVNGVGPLTVASLLSNTIFLAEQK